MNWREVLVLRGSGAANPAAVLSKSAMAQTDDRGTRRKLNNRRHFDENERNEDFYAKD